MQINNVNNVNFNTKYGLSDAMYGSDERWKVMTIDLRIETINSRKMETYRHMGGEKDA